MIFGKHKNNFKLIKSIINGNSDQDKIRPSNLSVLNNVFALSKSSPTRSVEVFNLEIADDSGKISKSKTYTHPLVSNGYGPVFTGLFSTNGDVFSALISPESNVLKTSLFSIASPDRLPISDLIVTNGARVVLGPYIQAFDENKDGNQELLIPFATSPIKSEILPLPNKRTTKITTIAICQKPMLIQVL